MTRGLFGIYRVSRVYTVDRKELISAGKIQVILGKICTSMYVVPIWNSELCVLPLDFIPRASLMCLCER